MMGRSAWLYQRGRYEGMLNISYSIESIELREFYTYILANLNGIMSHFVEILLLNIELSIKLDIQLNIKLPTELVRYEMSRRTLRQLNLEDSTLTFTPI